MATSTYSLDSNEVAALRSLLAKLATVANGKDRSKLCEEVYNLLPSKGNAKPYTTSETDPVVQKMYGMANAVLAAADSRVCRYEGRFYTFCRSHGGYWVRISDAPPIDLDA